MAVIIFARNALSWLWTLLCIPGTVGLGLLTAGWFLRAHGRRMAGIWGRGMLAILGIELVVEGAEQLAGRRPRIAVYNHTSTLDVFVLWSLMPDGGVPIVKKEIAAMPVIGWGARALDVITIDRGDTDAARRSLADAVRRIRTESLTLFIAPEGTRSADGRLGRFKTGALSLARDGEAPIIALLIDGCHRLQPKGHSMARSGRIRVRILPPVEPAAIGDDLRAFADGLHERFERGLQQWAAQSG